MPLLCDDTFEPSEEETALIYKLARQAFASLASQKPELILYRDGTFVAFEDADESLLEEWCCGYLEGTACDESWETDENAPVLLAPFFILSNLADLNELSGEQEETIDLAPYRQEARANLLAIINHNFAYWMGHDHEHDENCSHGHDHDHGHVHSEHCSHGQRPSEPYVRDEKIGRNDPCSCGSGKKYKKCCM